MIQPIQVILILFVLFAWSRAVLRFKGAEIRPLEFVFWSIIWAMAIVAIFSPTSISFVSNFFGIGRAVDLIIYVAIILLFYLNFRLYVAQDVQGQTITKLVREIAIRNKKK